MFIVVFLYKISVSQLAPLVSYVDKYAPVLPGAVFCCFNKNYDVHNIFNMTLHAGLVNPTCLQSLMVWYCSVCELRCLNSKEEKKKGQWCILMS